MKRLLVILALLVPAELPAPALASGVAENASPGGVLVAQRKTRRKPVRRRKPKRTPPKKAPPAKPAPTPPPAQAEEAAAAGASGSLRRSNRMEFDARLVQGQTAQSGAVYLFQRAPRQLPPLLKLRQSYLDRIVEPVLGPADDPKEER